MTDDTNKPEIRDNEWLDALLDEAGSAERPEPSPDLMTRVLEDAYAAQPDPAPVHSAHPAGAAGGWRQALQFIGGWGGVGGLVAATFAGFVIGLWSPTAIQAPFDAVVGMTLEDSDFGASGLTGFGWDLEEG